MRTGLNWLKAGFSEGFMLRWQGLTEVRVAYKGDGCFDHLRGYPVFNKDFT